jgi:hypothetical protein
MEKTTLNQLIREDYTNFNPLRIQYFLFYLPDSMNIRNIVKKITLKLILRLTIFSPKIKIGLDSMR